MNPSNHIPGTVIAAELYAVRNQRGFSGGRIQQMGVGQVAAAFPMDLFRTQIDVLEIRADFQKTVCDLRNLTGSFLRVHERHQREEPYVLEAVKKRCRHRKKVDHHQVGCPGGLQLGQAVKHQDTALFQRTDPFMQRHREIAESVVQPYRDFMLPFSGSSFRFRTACHIRDVRHVRDETNPHKFSSFLPRKLHKCRQNPRKIRQVAHRKHNTGPLPGRRKKICKLLIHLLRHANS